MMDPTTPAQPRAPLLGSIAGVLGVRLGEGRRTSLLFVHLLLASAIFILGRTVRDTLFLSRYSLAALPWMFVLYGVASAITVLLYSRFADRVKRSRMLLVSLAVGAATYLATYALVRVGAGWIYPGFYVWSEVVANLFIVQFWTLANDLHDARSARRLFPTIGAARVLGVVLIGLLSGLIVKAIGTEQLLLVLVALMFAAGVVVVRLGAEPRADSPLRARRGRPPRIGSDPYVLALAGLILLAFAALTIGDYQFKAIARERFHEDDLARFFGLFYAGTGVASFLFQLFVTPVVLRRFGVGWGLAVMPGVFGAASLVLPFAPHLAVATVMKFADNGFQYTVHDTTLQALYSPFRDDVKARTRAFLEAVIKPASYGIGGLILIALASRLPVELLSVPALVVVVAWIAMIPRVRARYVKSLQKTLTAVGSLAESSELVVDSRARVELLAVLERGDAEARLIALEQLEGETSPALARAVERLATADDPRVRIAALHRLAGLSGVDVQVVHARLADRDRDVRAAAAAAWARLAGDTALEELVGLRHDDAADVRVAALAGLFEHCGVEGAIEGGRELARLLASDDRDARVEAARVLRRLGRSAYRPVRGLLADPDPAVRRAALRAAEQVADPRLVPVLLDALAHRSTRMRAATALIAVGEPAIEPLISLLADPRTDRGVRLALPRILRAIPSHRTYGALRPLATTPDGHLRLRVLGALSLLRSKLDRPREPLAAVEELVRGELREAYRNLAAWRLADPEHGTVLMREELDFRQRRTIRRILRILELRYPRPPLGQVRSALEHTQRRGYAIETLDTLLAPSLRALVVPFLDEATIEVKLRAAAELVGDVPAPTEFLREQCRHPNPFVACLALESLARRPSVAMIEEAGRLLAHRDPLVREQALRTLHSSRPDEARERASQLASDPDPVVRALALAIAQGRPTMQSTLEKILLLKRAPLFASVSAEDLAPLARAAQERTFAAGEKVFAEGEVGDELYLVVSGRIAVSRHGEPIATLGPGEAFGEIAVLDAGPRTGTVTAQEDTEVLVIGSEEFYEILREQSEIAEGVIRMLTRRLRDVTEEM